MNAFQLSILTYLLHYTSSFSSSQSSSTLGSRQHTLRRFAHNAPPLVTSLRDPSSTAEDSEEIDVVNSPPPTPLLDRSATFAEVSRPASPVRIQTIDLTNEDDSDQASEGCGERATRREAQVAYVRPMLSSANIRSVQKVHQRTREMLNRSIASRYTPPHHYGDRTMTAVLPNAYTVMCAACGGKSSVYVLHMWEGLVLQSRMSGESSKSFARVSSLFPLLINLCCT